MIIIRKTAKIDIKENNPDVNKNLGLDWDNGTSGLSKI